MDQTIVSCIPKPAGPAHLVFDDFKVKMFIRRAELSGRSIPLLPLVMASVTLPSQGVDLFGSPQVSVSLV